MYNRCLISLLVLWSGYCGAQTFQAVYGFPNVTAASGTIAPGQVPQVNGLACGSFSAFGLSLNPNASGRFSFTGWPVGAADGADNYGTYTAALSPFSYYEVWLAPDPGYTLSLHSVRFSVRRSGTGIRTYCVRSSLDGFATNLAAGTGTSTNLQVVPDDVFFWKYDNTSTSSDQRGSEVVFGTPFSALTNAIYIRFYAWNAEEGNGTFSIDDVAVNGLIADSTLLSAITRQRSDVCVVKSIPGYIVNDCGLLSLELFATDGKSVRMWREPGHLISLSGIEPGLYVAILKTSKEKDRRQKLLLRQ